MRARVNQSPLVIAVAPNGALKTKADHPGLPVTPEEIAHAARRCLDAGASMMHLHVRDAQGRHSLEADHYAAAISAIQRVVGDELVIQVTSEAAGVYDCEQQIGHMRRVRPEAISLALREFAAETNDLRQTAGFFKWLADEHVVSQYILFSEDDLQLYRDLMTRGVVPDNPHWLLFVLGRYDTGFTSSPVSLLPFLICRQDDTPWAVCAFGRNEHVSAACAATLGGHVRLGFENNLYLKDGRKAVSNDQLIMQMTDVAGAIGRPLAKAEDLRRMFRYD